VNEQKTNQREHLRRLESIVEATVDAITTTGMDGKIDLWNPAAEALYGWTEAEALGAAAIDVLPAAGSVEPYAKVMAAAKKGVTWSGELLACRKDGREFPVLASVSPLYGAAGCIVGVLCSSRDISARKRAEEALRESEELFRKSFDTDVVAIAISRRRDGMYLEANPGFVKVTGYSRDEIVGHTSRELNFLTPQQRGAMLAAMDSSGRIHNQELTYPTKQGEWRTILFSIGPITVGNEPCLIATMVDISDRKQVERERNALIGELEAKNAELERFVYTISHDLKAPLITIKGFLGLLEEDAREGNTEQLGSDVYRIGKAAETMGRLLRDLLEYSHVGHLMFPPEDVSLEALAREATQVLAAQLEARKVRVEIAPNLPTLRGDRARLAEIMQNLMDNAVKYMGDQPAPLIEVGMRHDDDRRVFYVRDNGIGIEPRYQDRIFELFEKLNPYAEGSGLGLTIVRRIVETHGGRIWVESEGGGKGSTFCFTLREHGREDHTAR
jgi:PAS domain S-box-containing protein